MTFEEWLKEKKWNLNKASKFLGINYVSLRKVLYNSDNVGRKTAEKIEEKTLGEVNRIEVLWPEWSKTIRIVKKKETKDDPEI